MRLPAINLSQEDLSVFDKAINKEWLLTNGLGGYSASTVLGINTRKYHGLLVAALHPPGYRTVCLSKMDEDIHVKDEVFRLGANEFSGTIFPEGYKLLKAFSISQEKFASIYDQDHEYTKPETAGPSSPICP